MHTSCLLYDLHDLVVSVFHSVLFRECQSSIGFGLESVSLPKCLFREFQSSIGFGLESVSLPKCLFREFQSSIVFI